MKYAIILRLLRLQRIHCHNPPRLMRERLRKGSVQLSWLSCCSSRDLEVPSGSKHALKLNLRAGVMLIKYFSYLTGFKKKMVTKKSKAHQSFWHIGIYTFVHFAEMPITFSTLRKEYRKLNQSIQKKFSRESIIIGLDTIPNVWHYPQAE